MSPRLLPTYKLFNSAAGEEGKRDSAVDGDSGAAMARADAAFGRGIDRYQNCHEPAGGDGKDGNQQ